MDKTIEQTYTLQQEDELGSVKIADEVVATIAGIAATEVDGVVSMAGKALSKAVRVEVTGKNVSCDLALVVAYGYSIPVVSQKVQEKVKTTIESMTGLNVADVNIRISGVNM